jgi:RND family efflux transporter MFP subunit
MSTSEITSEINPAEVHKPQIPQSAPDPPRHHWLLIGVLIAVAVLGYVIYDGIHTRAASETALVQTTDQAAIPMVNVVLPVPNSLQQEAVIPGNTRAFDDTPIYARTDGYLKHWYVDIGAHVKAGQVLAQIETPEVDQQLLQARADLITAQANARLAKLNSTRYQQLLTQNAVTKQDTDTFVSQEASTTSTVNSMLANVSRLEQLQSFETVRAPFDGVITARNTDIGALINAGASGPPQELFHIAAIDRLRVYVAVPEIYSPLAENGAKATLTFDEFPGQIFQGTIVRNDNAIDPNSRTLNVEVDIANAQGRVKPGAYALVHLKLPRGVNTSASFTIPANTLLFRQEGLRVGVVRQGKAQLVPITIGRDYGDTVEVIAGLKADDQVIVNPSDSLISGSPVQINQKQEGNSP